MELAGAVPQNTYHLDAGELQAFLDAQPRFLQESIIINATGMGKDRPGSPLTDGCKFPMNSIIWEFNYRGTLEFMHQAEAQQEERKLQIEDGWTYFIHGWTQVIAEVFHIDITGERLAMCDKLAR